MSSEATVAFLVQPLTLLRFGAWLSAVVCFGVLADHGSVPMPGTRKCDGHSSISMYNCSSGALDYTIVVGIFAFLLASFFLVTTFLNEFTSSLAQYRKKLETFEFGASCLWSFLFFVAFCFTTNKWTAGECDCGDNNKFNINPPSKDWVSSQLLKDAKYVNAAQSGIAFAFFSTIFWGAIAGLLFRKMFYGSDDAMDDAAFKGAADPEPGDANFPYAPFENNGSDADMETPYTQYDDEASYNN